MKEAPTRASSSSSASSAEEEEETTISSEENDDERAHRLQVLTSVSVSLRGASLRLALAWRPRVIRGEDLHFGEYDAACRGRVAAMDVDRLCQQGQALVELVVHLHLEPGRKDRGWGVGGRLKGSHEK